MDRTEIHEITHEAFKATRDRSEKMTSPFLNKLSDEQFQRIADALKPYLVAKGAEFDAVESPEERRVRIDDERDASDIAQMQKEIARLTAKREARARNRFRDDADIRKESLNPTRKLMQLDFDREALNKVLESIIVDEKMNEELEALTLEESEFLASEIHRMIEDDDAKRLKDDSAYRKIDWEQVAKEYDERNPDQ